MDDLQLTKEFEEAIAAISSDILQNPQKYKQAGKWLDRYYDNKFCNDKFRAKCEKQLSSGLPLELWFYSDYELRSDAYSYIQAVAFIDCSFFLDIHDIIKESFGLNATLPNPTRQTIKSEFLALFSNKARDINLSARLLIACEELLNIKKHCQIVGKEDAKIICLLSWLLANPDIDNFTENLTKFQNWQWYKRNINGIHPERAKVAQQLSILDKLQDWQNLACEAWQNIKNIDSGTERPTKKDVNTVFNDVGANLPAERKKEKQTNGGKKQSWEDDAVDYMLLSEAIVKFAGNKPAVSTLSKKITPNGPIRYMRRGRRCKVHIGDFIEFAKKKYPSNDLAAEITDEYMADIEVRKAEERKHRPKKQ